MPAPVTLRGLRPQTYEHPADAAALNALQHNAGLENLLRKLSGWGVERMLRIQLTGSYLQVTPGMFPALYALFQIALVRLDLPIRPELYIQDSDEINAYTAGVEQPIVVLTRGAVDRLHDDELLFVLAHEVGHIKSGHVLYYQIANVLPRLGQLLGEVSLGIGSLLSFGVEMALLQWQRTSELTADRAGLLAVQDIDAATRTFMKMSGLPEKFSKEADPKHFIQQAMQFEQLDLKVVDRAAKYLSIYGQNHPWTVLRARELVNWIQTGGYERVLTTPHTSPHGFCNECGKPRTDNDQFCRHCGYRQAT